MNKYKILFLDIDGTILTREHTIQDSTKSAISLMKKKNIEVFLATGRPFHEISNIYEELEVESCIAYNGAFAIYKDEIVYSKPMDASLINRLILTME